MIVQLSKFYSRKIACFFLLTYYLSFVLPASIRAEQNSLVNKWKSWLPMTAKPNGYKKNKVLNLSDPGIFKTKKSSIHKAAPTNPHQNGDIGGPSQPEMSSFKSVGVDNMVNLFTGDFSYNIPLLDVGGYPINLYYDGGITMEQEASWVGLGWNLNPGNINRNVRGVPDDFNGTDTLKQTQNMRKNKTWGLGVGGDMELLGIKALRGGGELGVAFNNYLGPSLDLALRGQASYKIANLSGSEKITAASGLNIGIDINSRSGASFSGGVSLTSNAEIKDNTATFGIGLSTSYNSRTGIKALQISGQSFLSSNTMKQDVYKKSDETYEYRAGGSINPTLYSTSISFVKPSYVPSLRMPLTNTAWSGHFQLGLGAFGVAADLEAEVYGEKSEIAPADTLQKKLMVGYLYYQNAINNPSSVMDFTRVNDKEVTPNTPVISIPQYSYDVFTIQGEGTGGSIRAYRNDLGYVRDNISTSKDKNVSIGGDIDPWGHYGGNFNTIKTPSTIGEWNTGNKLRSTVQFTNASSGFENVYFRNPGENCVIDSGRYSQIGGTNLVRFVLGGRNNSPTIEPKLQSFSSLLVPGSTFDLSHFNDSVRNKRTQVINFLTAQEASVAGLDKVIKTYDNNIFLDPNSDTLIYQSIPRVSSYRKSHHISQINVTESNGKRYIYGIPVYNVTQTDFTFTVPNNSQPQIPDKVSVDDSTYLSAQSPLLGDGIGRDGYVQATTTPAYAHSFLLSGILSPDYVDVTGNGISEDDIGEAVKFNYIFINYASGPNHMWRTPLTLHDSANFNPGLRSEIRDDKGIISYGERESWYLSSVESKTMVAFFYTSKRPYDGRGAAGVYGGINSSDSSLRELDSIALYNKADLRKNGLSKAKPIKTVHFKYSNTLCQNTPDNPSGPSGSKGKLTLDSLWFTYNGTARVFKNKYSFNYSSNPSYTFASSDRWGTYKPYGMNPGSLTNRDYPYSIQDTTQKAIIDQNASAWMLNKIVLPSGGEIDVSYESDDYAYVQDKRATEMMNIVGFSTDTNYVNATDRLYPSTNTSGTENDYVFIHVTRACSGASDVYNMYLQGATQLSFRIWVIMPKGPEYITCYASYSSYGVVSSNHNIIWVKMNRLANKSPLSLTALEYLRQQLPGQAFPGYDVSGEPTLKQVGDMLVGMLSSLRNAFTDPVNAFRKDGKAMHTDLTKCFVRLNDPDGNKYGGGYRVDSILLKDNWNKMTGQFTSTYGKHYVYTTTENFNGTIRTVSSGVASYEPSIGSEENPFQTIIQVEDYLPAGPTSFGAVEMPAMDAFFPAPVVGYSKVTVTSIKTDTSSAKKTRSGIGKQVTEFYTAKDFPVYYNYTPFDAGSVKEFHQASTTAFFNKYAYDYKAQSQGFIVAINDMHGKMKSQSSYAENDTTTRISYTENFYRNTGVNGLNEKFSFINKDNGGTVYNGNMGIDVDLMTDAREFSVKASSRELQGQVDWFYFIVPFPIPTLWPVSGVAENTYRAITTTKVVNYHSVLDSVVVIDKGSQVSTKNLAYDAQTGEVLVTRTNNEFNQAIYNTSYPAYWAYGGMGLAYKNIDATYSGINFADGKITNSGFDFSVFESGDELLIKSFTPQTTGCNAQVNSGSKTLVWAFDKNKNSTSLITTPNFIFIDSIGIPFTDSLVSFRIIRSGHRNILDAKAETITSMVNPLTSGKLVFDTTSKVINASAVEFKEKWQIDNDVIRRLKIVNDTVTCTLKEVEDSLGYLEKNINPYRKGLIGNFRPYRSMVFYNNRKEYDTTANTNLSANGFLNNFKLYWDFNSSSNLVPDTTSTQWVWNSKLTKVNAKGLELETQDALGIYTSAQYGYNKTMPVAIANNARYNEMFADGFEDYGYDETLDNTKFNMFRRHIDFSKMTNSFLVNTDTANFKAHSGKYVLAVNATGTLNIPYNPGVEDFGITVSPSNLNQLVQGPLGGNFTQIYSNVKLDNPSTVFNSGNVLGGVFYTIIPYIPSNANPPPPLSQVSYNYMVSTSQYFQINSKGTYTIYFVAVNNFNSPSGSNPFPQFMSISVYDSINNITYTGTELNSTTGSNSYTRTKTFCLDKGVYIMYLQFYVSRSYSCTPSPSSPNCALAGGNQYLEEDDYSIFDSNTPSNNSIQFFRNYTTVTGCSYTKPIAATDSMMNTTVSISPGKKMIFSGWVHENCGDPVNGISCKDSTYTHNQVQLKFGGNGANDVTLNPTGPIIDGWQRYEGTFTAPTGTTNMTLNFVNSGTSTIYFDDIRIHPFNSNMKSYIYDPVSLRLMAELDANNYASFYEYDEEGTLIRTKVETRQGIKTVTETRSFLQKAVH